MKIFDLFMGKKEDQKLEKQDPEPLSADSSRYYFRPSLPILRPLQQPIPFHKFNLGRSALKIKPGEAFTSILSFNGAPSVSQDVGMMVVLTGLMWSPL